MPVVDFAIVPARSHLLIVFLWLWRRSLSNKALLESTASRRKGTGRRRNERETLVGRFGFIIDCEKGRLTLCTHCSSRSSSRWCPLWFSSEKLWGDKKQLVEFKKMKSETYRSAKWSDNPATLQRRRVCLWVNKLWGCRVGRSLIPVWVPVCHVHRFIADRVHKRSRWMKAMVLQRINTIYDVKIPARHTKQHLQSVWGAARTIREHGVYEREREMA
jgi:hypothetical protein